MHQHPGEIYQRNPLIYSNKWSERGERMDDMCRWKWAGTTHILRGWNPSDRYLNTSSVLVLAENYNSQEVSSFSFDPLWHKKPQKCKQEYTFQVHLHSPIDSCQSANLHKSTKQISPGTSMKGNLLACDWPKLKLTLSSKEFTYLTRLCWHSNTGNSRRAGLQVLPT